MPFHMRVFVEFERAIISERVRAGLERVGQNGLWEPNILHRREILWQRDSALCRPTIPRQCCRMLLLCETRCTPSRPAQWSRRLSSGRCLASRRWWDH